MGIKCRINRNEVGQVIGVTTESGGKSVLFEGLSKMFGKEKALDLVALANSKVMKAQKALKDSKIKSKNANILRPQASVFAKAIGAVADKPGYFKFTMGGSSVFYKVNKNKSIDLELVETPASERGKGSARAAMSNFLNKAGAYGFTVELMVAPRDKTTSESKLKIFYKSLGFEFNGTDFEMIRRPMKSDTLETPRFSVKKGVTLYHGTANVLEGGFDVNKSNTSDTVFLTDSENFANQFSFEDEYRPDGVTYEVTANLENTFDSNTDEAVKELEPLIRQLVKENYTYKTGLNYRTDLKQINIGETVIENPTEEDFVQHYLWRAKSNWRLMESPRVIEFLKEKGYDSFTIKERGSNNIAVFDSSKIETKSYKNKSGKVTEIRDQSLDQEVIDRLKESGLSEEVFQLTTQEIDAKLKELGVDVETRKSVRNVDRRNKIIREAMSLETYSIEDEVSKYFISGGTVSTNSIDTLYKNSKGEKSARRSIIDKSAPSVLNIAHSLWENSIMRNDEGESIYTDQDYANAIEEHLSMYNNRLDMAKDMLKKYNLDQFEPDFDYYEVPDELIEEEMVKRGLMQKGITQIVNGFVFNNDVYLNKDVATNETAIHEHNHLLTSWLKENRKEVYKRGIDLINKELKNKNSDIKSVIDYVKSTQPNLKGEALAEEILTQLVGEKGAALINAKKSSGIIDWLQEVWAEIAGMLGITSYSDADIASMTLGEYAEAMAVEVLSGQKIAQQVTTPYSYGSTTGNDIRFSILSEYRDNTKFKYSDLIYPDVVFKDINSQSEAKVGEAFYKKIVGKFNKVFDRDLKVTSKVSDNNFNVVVEYETGLKPKYFAYPTAVMGEHETVDDIDKNVPLTSLRHELIHEMLVKNITDKFERINNLDNSANIVSIEEVQRNRAYNYTLEDVFFERVVENVERNPDNKDTFEVSTFGEDVTNRLKKELEGQDMTKDNVINKLNELLEGSNPWLTDTLLDIFENRVDYNFKDLSDINEEIGNIFKQRFTLSKDVFSKELQSKIFQFTEFFNQEYTGVLTRLNKIGERNKLKRVVPGNTLFSAPLEDASTIADAYIRKNGIVAKEIGKITKLDVENSKKIAQEFEKLVPTPFDKDTIESYQAMITETLTQYEEIIGNGYNVEINNEEPYNSSGDMIEDLRANKRMRIFSTESGFGGASISDKQRAENPLSQETKFKDVNGVPLLANDVFRFVHDFFGHAKFGNGFGAIGEENAWNVHVKMYSPLAARAMTTETRGQNSWVNFSGVNEAAFVKRDQARVLRKNGNTEEAQKLTQEVYEMMSFAEQKVGLLPEWVSLDSKEKEEAPETIEDVKLDEISEELSIEDVLTYAASTDYQLTEEDHIDLQNVAYTIGVGSYAELLTKMKQNLVKNGVILFTEKNLMASGMYNKFEVNSILEDMSLQEAIKRTYQGLLNSENRSFEQADPLYVVSTPNINALGKQEILNPFQVEDEVKTAVAGRDLSVDLDVIPYDSIKNAYNKGSKEALDKVATENRNVPTKKMEFEDLVDKTENANKEIFERTIDFSSVDDINAAKVVIENISPEVWSKSSDSIYTLLKDFNQKAAEIGADFIDLESHHLTKSREEVIDLIVSFTDLLNRPTTENMEFFFKEHTAFFKVSEEPMIKTIATKSEDSVFLETDVSEVSLFNEYGLVKESENVYRQIEKIEDVEEAYEILLQNKSIIPSDIKTVESLKQHVAEIIQRYNIDTFDINLSELENMILHKIYFGAPMAINSKKDSNAEVRASNFEGDYNYLINQYTSDFYKSYLREKRAGSDAYKDFYSNLTVTEKGIVLVNTDPISIAKMEPYIDQDLNDYNLISKHLNLPLKVSEITVDKDDMQFNREYAISNPSSVDKVRGDYKIISPETIAVVNEVKNFVKTPTGIFEYDYQSGNIAFYNKLPEGNENFNSYGQHKIKSESSVDARDYGNLETIPGEFVIAKKYYSKSELDKINKNNFSC